MYKQPIPRTISITPLGGGVNLAKPQSEWGAYDKRVLLRLNYRGDMFGRGSAQAVFYKPNTTTFPVQSGRWVISVGGITRFVGYLTETTGERSQGGNIEILNFTDVMQGWDVLLNKVFPETANANYTVGQLLSDLVSGAVSISGIGLQTILPVNNTLLSALYQSGNYSALSTTYLAEIQRVCQNLGYVVFCDVATGKVSILDPFNLNRGVFYFNPDTLIDASFSINYLRMASTVFVNDDLSMRGDAYGYMGTGANKNDVVYNFSGINNLVMATTVGIKEDKLAEVAAKLYNIGKNQSRVLTVTHAGGVYSNFSLGADLVWSDYRGAVGTYTIFEYETVISKNEYKTTYRAYVKL